MVEFKFNESNFEKTYEDEINWLNEELEKERVFAMICDVKR